MSVSDVVQSNWLGLRAYSGVSRSTKGSIVKKARYGIFLLLVLVGTVYAVVTWTPAGAVVGCIMAASGVLGMFAVQGEERKTDE